MSSTYQAEPYHYSQDYSQYAHQSSYQYDQSQYSGTDQYSSGYGYGQYTGDASSAYTTAGYNTGQYDTSQYNQYSQNTSYTGSGVQDVYSVNTQTTSAEGQNSGTLSYTAAATQSASTGTTATSGVDQYGQAGAQFPVSYSSYNTDGTSYSASGQFGSAGPGQYPQAPPGQYGSTAPAAQYGNTGPPAQYGSTAPAAQYGNTAPAAQYGNTGPAAQYGNTAPAAQYGNTAPAALYGNTPSGQYGATAPGQSGGGAEQYQSGSTTESYTSGDQYGQYASSTDAYSNPFTQYSSGGEYGQGQNYGSSSYSDSDQDNAPVYSTSDARSYSSSGARGYSNNDNNNRGRGGFGSGRGGHAGSNRGIHSSFSSGTQSGGYQAKAGGYNQSGRGSGPSSQYRNGQRGPHQQKSVFGRLGDPNRSYGQGAYDKGPQSFGAGRGGRGGANRGNSRFQRPGDHNRGGSFGGSGQKRGPSDRNWITPQDARTSSKTESSSSQSDNKSDSGSAFNTGSSSQPRAASGMFSVKSKPGDISGTGSRLHSPGSMSGKISSSRDSREGQHNKSGRVFGSGDREPFSLGSRAKTFTTTSFKSAGSKTGNTSAGKGEGKKDTLLEGTETDVSGKNSIQDNTSVPANTSAGSAARKDGQDNAGVERKKTSGAKPGTGVAEDDDFIKPGMTKEEIEREKEIQRKIRESVVTLVTDSDPTEDEIRNMLKPPDALEIPEHLRETLQSLMTERHCILCSLRLNAPLQAAQHYQGKNHLKRVRFFISSDGQSTSEKPATVVTAATVVKTVAAEGGIAAEEMSAQSVSSGAGDAVVKPSASAAGDGAKAAEEAPEPNEFEYCTLCSVSFTSLKQAEQHYNGKNHAKKVRLIAANKCLEEAASKNLLKKCDNDTYECALCNVIVICEEQLNTHFRGMKHQAKLQKQQQLSDQSGTPVGQGRGRGRGRGMRGGGRGGYAQGEEARPQEFAPMYRDEPRGRGRGGSFNRGGFSNNRRSNFTRRGGRGEGFRGEYLGRFEHDVPNIGRDRMGFDSGYVERFPVSDGPPLREFGHFPTQRGASGPGFKRRQFDDYGASRGKRPRRGF